ncbi:hypothetical protein FGB62_11g119 [Gracilaria domingensis]|nr:hypothetical protein FGB62_11g119 [Gracilaria domingensis]
MPPTHRSRSTEKDSREPQAEPTRNPDSNHFTSRKRSREFANDDSEKHHEMIGNETEEYFDDNMDSDEEEDVLPDKPLAHKLKTPISRAAAFVPYYSHLGGDDLDDEYVATSFL